MIGEDSGVSLVNATSAVSDCVLNGPVGLGNDMVRHDRQTVPNSGRQGAKRGENTHGVAKC